MKIDRTELIGVFGYEKTPPTSDFNREIAHPGVHPKFPKGCVGIRCDDDFWRVAALPYKYLDTKIEDIVKDLWPKLSKIATYGPDVIYE